MNCTCGFYAYFDRPSFDGLDEPLLSWMDIQSDWYPYGIIEGYGKIIMGTFGFRAEKARIKALVASSVLQLRDRVAARYPTIEFFDSIEEAKEAYPVMSLEQAERML